MEGTFTLNACNVLVFHSTKQAVVKLLSKLVASFPDALSLLLAAIQISAGGLDCD